jgi:glyoxylase-like metal-dependent hydrolase (beta-lactamase superfamily II)
VDVRPGLRVLTDDIDATTLTMVLLGEEDGLIVDTGLPASLDQVVLPDLARKGRSPPWIRTIVNTHCHSDHVGGNAALVDLAAPRVLIHAREAAYLADPARFVLDLQARDGDGRRQPAPDLDEIRRLYGRGTAPDAVLEDGDHLLVDGQDWQVVHTPGHSPGGICLYEAATQTLITGDAIQAEGTTSCDLAFYFDASAYARSVDKVAALDVAMIIAGHPFKPFPSAILVGADARRFLELSRAAPARYREQVLSILSGARTALSTALIAERLTEANSFARCVGSAVHTTRAHLEELRSQGRVERVYARGFWHWRLAP